MVPAKVCVFFLPFALDGKPELGKNPIGNWYLIGNQKIKMPIEHEQTKYGEVNGGEANQTKDFGTTLSSILWHFFFIIQSKNEVRLLMSYYILVSC